MNRMLLNSTSIRSRRGNLIAIVDEIVYPHPTEKTDCHNLIAWS